MDVKEAVKAAKTYVQEVFSEEKLTNLGLEEVERDEHLNLWRVTLGFSRPWNTPRNPLYAVTQTPNPVRAYKIVSLNDSGKVVSIKLRESAFD